MTLVSSCERRLRFGFVPPTRSGRPQGWLREPVWHPQNGNGDRFSEFKTALLFANFTQKPREPQMNVRFGTCSGWPDYQ